MAARRRCDGADRFGCSAGRMACNKMSSVGAILIPPACCVLLHSCQMLNRKGPGDWTRRRQHGGLRLQVCQCTQGPIIVHLPPAPTMPTTITVESGYSMRSDRRRAELLLLST